MARSNRFKIPNGTYHIIVKGCSDLQLYKSTSDKEKYLKLLKKYQDIFKFKVYSYCIMTTHAHIIIDSFGSDISKVMHNINQSYAQYYNFKHNRHGHVFQDRFKSIIVEESSYLLTLSAYIHNNPKDIKGYRNQLELYPYSSLGIYLGISKDTYNLIDTSLVFSHFSKDIIKARHLYNKFRKASLNTKLNNAEYDHRTWEYRSEKKVLLRNYPPEKILNYVSKLTNQSPNSFHVKCSHSTTEFRALSIFLMRSMCDFTYKQICSYIGNLTLSQASKLCNKGLNLVQNNEKYSNIFDYFLKDSSTTQHI